ncbi:MAG: ATP-binding protein [Fibrobacteria bacterium]|nr:ATP-binding protein [Fibrobacteria bacterium]
MAVEANFPARLEDLADMMSFLEESGGALGVPAGLQAKLALACEEAFVNVISYAYPDGEGSLRIAVEGAPSGDPPSAGVEIVLTDSGIPFDPLARQMPDTSLAPEDRPIGGLGILLIRRTMDEVRYRRENGRNILTMRKRFADS